jgi:hypothetical protein
MITLLSWLCTDRLIYASRRGHWPCGLRTHTFGWFPCGRAELMDGRIHNINKVTLPS